MKRRISVTLANIILISIVGFLAIDIGSSLYNPGRLNAVLPFSTLEVIGGNIQVQARNAIAWEKASDGMALEPGSRVRTDSNGYVALAFLQGTTAKLEPGTDIIISELENDRENELSGVTLRHQAGKIWNQVSRLDDDSYHFQIETPSADIKVQGTLFAAEVDEDGKTTVQTTDGSVSVSAQGKEVQVPAGQQTTVMPGEPPAAPEPIPPPASEMVLTIEKATGLVTDPSGSSTGYLPDGTALNQIAGSQLSAPEAQSQTVRIPEPAAGPYTLTSNGRDARVSVEAFAEGKPTLSYTEDVTGDDNFILKLHLDVLNGLLGNAADVKPVPAEPLTAASPEKTAPPEPEASKPAATGDGSAFWVSAYDDIDRKWVIIGSIVLILFGVLLIAWKKM